MSIKFDSSEITQYRIKFKNDDKDVIITLTMGYCIWKFDILKGNGLTLEELIEICDLIYSKVIDEKACIEIALNNKEQKPICIHGAKQVTSEILKSVKVTFPGNKR